MAKHKAKTVGKNEDGTDISMYFPTLANLVKCIVPAEGQTVKEMPLNELLAQYADEINGNTNALGDKVDKKSENLLAVKSAMEIEAVDITGQSVDANTLVSERYKTWTTKTDGGTGNITNIPMQYGFFLEFKPARYTGLTASKGIQIITYPYTGGSSGAPQRIYRRWYHQGVAPEWTDWIQDGSCSTPSDITNMTLDLDDINSANGYRGICYFLQQNTGGAANIANTPDNIKNAFSLEYMEVRTNIAGSVSAGIQTAVMSNDTGGYRRVYKRWWGSGSMPQWTPWVLDGTISTTVTIITIEGTVSFINAELRKLPKLLNHNLTINIVDGDYSGETLTVPSNMIFNGEVQIYAKIAAKIEDKKAKIKSMVVNNCYFAQLGISYLGFEGGDTAHCINIIRCSGFINTTYCDFRMSKTKIDSTSYYGIFAGQNNNIVLQVSDCRFNQLQRGVSAVTGVSVRTWQIDFYNSIYDIYAAEGAIVSDNSNNTRSNVTHQNFKDKGMIAQEMQTFKRWTSGSYTGVTNEFVFAKLMSGTYIITIQSSGSLFVGTHSWKIHNGYSVTKAQFLGSAGTVAQPSKIKLEFSRVGATSILLKAICSNPNIGAATNSIAVTITPLHATDSDGYVVLNPTDTPTTWVEISNETAEDKIAALEARISALENL